MDTLTGQLLLLVGQAEAALQKALDANRDAGGWVAGGERGAMRSRALSAFHLSGWWPRASGRPWEVGREEALPSPRCAAAGSPAAGSSWIVSSVKLKGGRGETVPPSAWAMIWWPKQMPTSALPSSCGVPFWLVVHHFFFPCACVV